MDSQSQGSTTAVACAVTTATADATAIAAATAPNAASQSQHGRSLSNGSTGSTLSSGSTGGLSSAGPTTSGSAVGPGGIVNYDAMFANQPYKQCEVFFKIKDSEGRPKKVSSQWLVHPRYNLCETLGTGGYGTVVSAVDNATNQHVAMKRVPNPFAKPIEGLRLLRELKLLQFFNDHENIVSLKDIMRPRSHEEFVDVYFVTELMQTDLHWLIRSPQDLSPAHVQYFAYQMLRAMKYIHSASVLHRDLKPGNVLVNKDCSLKICDLGLARGVDFGHRDGDLTEYVVTRWYRAPELLLQSRSYDATIDIWSCGCIIAELFNRKPLFPGRDYIDQLNKILAVCGSPSEEVMTRMDASEQAKRWLRMQPRRAAVPVASLVPSASPLAVDLLERMLSFDPSLRCSAEEALAHPFFQGLHNLASEPVCQRQFDWSFEKHGSLSCEQIKQLVWEMGCQFHPDLLNEHRL